MPHVFQSHREFKEWFANPLTGMIEGSHEYNESLIKRLHKVFNRGKEHIVFGFQYLAFFFFFVYQKSGFNILF
jgi:hypothetical protein